GTALCDENELARIYEQAGPLLYDGDTPIGLEEVHRRGGLFLQLDLAGIGGTHCVGYKAKAASGLIDLSRLNHYKVFDYWDPVFWDNKGQLLLNRHDFYLLISKERVRIPPGYAESEPFLWISRDRSRADLGGVGTTSIS